MNAEWKRKTPSLFGVNLERALRGRVLWHQSEKLPEYLRFFVGKRILAGLATNANQLVCGRRGTGKTHVLGAFAESINSNRNRRRVAVYLSALAFSETPRIFTAESIEFRRSLCSRLLFEAFLRRFAEVLLEQLEEHLKYQCARMNGREEARQYRRLVEDAYLRLMKAINEGVPVMTGGHETEIRRELKKTAAAGGIKADLSVGTGGLSGNLGGGLNADRGSESNVETATTREASVMVDLSSVRRALLDLIDTANIDVLYLLIDEWMELDKNLNVGIQPYFAQLLKVVFFNNKRLAVKIASVWHRTDLYNRLDLDRAKGLELGEDIELGLDLDAGFAHDEVEIEEFFKKLLLRRLSYHLPELSSLAEEGGINNAFVQELFDNERNFRSLIAASHCVPRDFLQIFEKCLLKIEYRCSEYALSRDLVRQVAWSIFLVEKRRSVEEASPAHALWEEVNGLLEKTGQRLFLVRNGAAGLSEALRKLVDEELVHQIPSAMTPRQVRDHFKAFYLDYGTYVDWVRSKRGPQGEVPDEGLIPSIPADVLEHLDAIVVDPMLHDDARVECPECHSHFLRSAPVYVKSGWCPHCANPVSKG